MPEIGTAVRQKLQIVSAPFCTGILEPDLFQALQKSSKIDLPKFEYKSVNKETCKKMREEGSTRKIKDERKIDSKGRKKKPEKDWKKKRTKLRSRRKTIKC